MKTFVIGDIHGLYKGFLQVIKSSGIDRKKDKIIVLGDVCDGFPFVKECFEELLTFKKLVYVLGNHDDWAREWYSGDMGTFPCDLWTSQGGQATIDSYGGIMVSSHLNILLKAKHYYEDRNMLFVHGGIDELRPVDKQSKHDMLWDRDMWNNACSTNIKNNKYNFGDWDTIFIGHTTTQAIGTTEPARRCNVMNLDTGAGWSGRLTIMDVDSNEFWQSDYTKNLYPEIKGRG